MPTGPTGVLKILDPASSSWIRIGGVGATGPTGPSGGPTGVTGPTGPAGPPPTTGVAVRPGSSVQVNSSGATTVVASNATRKQVWVYNNDSAQTVYLALGTGATQNSGIRLNPNGGAWTCTTYTGPIAGVCTNAGVTGTAYSYVTIAEI